MKRNWRKEAAKWIAVASVLGVLDLGLQMYFRSVAVGELNKGISFGLFSGISLLVLLLFWLAMLLFLVRSIRKNEDYRGLLLIVAGGSVNIMTRYIWGGVWDYIQLPVLSLWFNMSDVLITLGVIGFILLI